MSAWFSIRLSPRAGSLTAATAALAHAHVAVEAIIGTPESEDGVVHVGVAEGDLARAVQALGEAGISVEPGDGGPAVDPTDGTGLLDALLRGPRS